MERVAPSRGVDADDAADGDDGINAGGDEIADAEGAVEADVIGSVQVGDDADDSAGTAAIAPGPDEIGSGRRRTPLELMQ